ncbi:MAG: transglycosylase SLT domain-containing protein [Minisyncoccia bacterium]|jgi:hypothetical protein
MMWILLNYFLFFSVPETGEIFGLDGKVIYSEEELIYYSKELEKFDEKYGAYIDSLSKLYDINKGIIYAIMLVESGPYINTNPCIIGKHGEIGVMQITYKEFVRIKNKNNWRHKFYDLCNPKINILYFLEIYKPLLDKYQSVEKATIIYNCGSLTKNCYNNKITSRYIKYLFNKNGTLYVGFNFSAILKNQNLK